MSDLYDDIIAKDKARQEQTSIIRNNLHNKTNAINEKTVSFKRILALILVVISVAMGVTLGCTLYKHEVQGYHTVCYIAKTGECYHAGYCGYLYSSHKTNVYSAKKRGYRSCSRCSVGSLDTSKKSEIVYGLLTTFAVSTIAFIIISVNKKRTDEETVSSLKRLSDDKITLIDKEFNDYLNNQIKMNGVLKIVDAPEHIQLINGKLYSSKEDIYRYVGRYGDCYHVNKNCIKGDAYKVLVYDVIGKYYSCGKCHSFYSDTKPQWYEKFEILNSMLKRGNSK